MFQFIETIKIKNNEPINLALHQERVALTFKKFFGDIPPLALNRVIETVHLNPKKIYKCKVIYNNFFTKVSFDEYQLKKINKIKLVDIKDFDYSFKFADRSFFNQLPEQYPEYDEFILVKNNCITDSTYANLIFYDGSEWYTPDTYLLNGTKRQSLLNGGLIHEKRITLDDLSKFLEIHLINAMIEMREVKIETSQTNLFQTSLK